MQHTDALFYRFRFMMAGIFILAFFVAISALVTAAGANSILDSRTGSHVATFDASMSDSPNVVTAGAYGLVGGTQHVLLSVGTGLYGACRSITATTTQSGKAIGHGSASVARGVGSAAGFVVRGVGNGIASVASGVGNGVGFVAHGVGSVIGGGLHVVGNGVGFVVRLPGKAVGSVASVHTVSALIRPADDKPVPVIDSETSAEILATLNARQKEEIAKLFEAQIAANRGLGGSIVAGDPTHGGYPAKWDNIRQDSRIDSWGMYNRECVSYAAWKVYQTYGNMPYWGGVGNANQWVRNAKRAGIPTSSVPKAQSVAISMRGYYGHAMWVEKVAGNMIYVSQYNYDLRGHYSEMWLDSRNLTYIYFH